MECREQVGSVVAGAGDEGPGAVDSVQQQFLLADAFLVEDRGSRKPLGDEARPPLVALHHRHRESVLGFQSPREREADPAAAEDEHRADARCLAGQLGHHRRYVLASGRHQHAIADQQPVLGVCRHRHTVADIADDVVRTIDRALSDGAADQRRGPGEDALGDGDAPVAEVLGTDGSGQQDRRAEVVGRRALGMDDEVDAEDVVGEGLVGAEEVVVAYPCDGAPGAEHVRREGGDGVDLVALGHRHHEVGRAGVELLEKARRSPVAHDHESVELVLQTGGARLVGVDDRDVMARAAERVGDVLPDFAGADDDHSHAWIVAVLTAVRCIPARLGIACHRLRR